MQFQFQLEQPAEAGMAESFTTILSLQDRLAGSAIKVAALTAELKAAQEKIAELEKVAKPDAEAKPHLEAVPKESA